MEACSAQELIQRAVGPAGAVLRLGIFSAVVPPMRGGRGRMPVVSVAPVLSHAACWHLEEAWPAVGVLRFRRPSGTPLERASMYLPCWGILICGVHCSFAV
eukprot:jgi/Ulvmu1/12298/UM088_0016.1